ncbi:MAG TPA: hypothetical protein VGI79_07570 [Caulobacteraceae bacterium]|jgi:hypothetical protein
MAEPIVRYAELMDSPEVARLMLKRPEVGNAIIPRLILAAGEMRLRR